MANLDLKDAFLKSPELFALAKKLGNRRIALGVIIEFWELAQEYWVRGSLIPEAVFKIYEFPEELFDKVAGFAVRKDGGIYAIGSEEHFDWLIKKRCAAAKNGRAGGIASGIARSNNNKELVKQTDVSLKQTPQKRSLPIPIPIPIPKEENTCRDLPITDVPPVPKEMLSYDEEHESVEKNPAGKNELPKLAKLWNELAHESLARVRHCSPARKNTASKRWKENPSEEFWRDVIFKINQSDFCLGKTAGGWVANFDFLIKPNSASKALEGNYDNRRQAISGKEPRQSAARQIELLGIKGGAKIGD